MANISEAFGIVLSALIFKVISTRWQPIYAIGIISRGLTLFMYYWVIESPKFLIAEKNYE
jgi:hypothetical protein